ncbi:MAG: 3-deoxy-8-phosphooctulonate synthase [Verrucomicrobiota bacterium]|nr:3-deoxy-8-phosphooctulonate synthase [Verrucomicrobiota bacterium]
MPIFDPSRLLLIAGPCSLENLTVARTVADMLARLRDRHPELNIVFKGSFDKANRTSIGGDRGPGLQEGLRIHSAIKQIHGFPCLTDIHEPAEAAPVANVCDVLQIPAFLCRQTDILVAAARTARVVNVKKGQFLSPYEMQFVVEKLRQTHAAEIWQTERGTTFGYQNLVVDMRSFAIMKSFGTPSVMDATHSVQLPGAGGGKSGGQREYVPALARAALAAGADGLFLETHPNPAEAISDAATQIPCAEFPAVIESCLRIWRAVRG